MDFNFLLPFGTWVDLAVMPMSGLLLVFQAAQMHLQVIA